MEKRYTILQLTAILIMKQFEESVPDISSRYEALPRNAIFVALPLNGGRASGIPFPGRAWEREK